MGPDMLDFKVAHGRMRPDMLVLGEAYGRMRLPDVVLGGAMREHAVCRFCSERYTWWLPMGRLSKALLRTGGAHRSGDAKGCLRRAPGKRREANEDCLRGGRDVHESEQCDIVGQTGKMPTSCPRSCSEAREGDFGRQPMGCRERVNEATLHLHRRGRLRSARLRVAEGTQGGNKGLLVVCHRWQGSKVMFFLDGQRRTVTPGGGSLRPVRSQGQ